MRGPAKLIVLALAMLLAAAFFLRREPAVEEPRKTTRPEQVAGPPLPPAEPIVSTSVSATPPVQSPRLRTSPAAGGPGAGSLRGTVKVLGEPPRRKKVKMASDPKCLAMHSVDVLSEALVVSPEGEVKWAFVYIASGVGSQPPKGMPPPVLLDQVKCMFEPHVVGVQVGQPLNIYNTDGILHVAHGTTFANPEFNFGMSKDGLCKTLTFASPEMMIKVRCDIHPWMVAWIAVMDHPYFAVTSDAGAYAIPDVPAGRFLVQVWHETYATVTREVEVPPGRDARLDFILDARKP
jgi:hypothetical protein